MHTQPKLSIAVLSWNTKQITKDCIESIIRNVQGVTYELILIENASHDGSAEMIKQHFPTETYPQIRSVFNDENTGFAGGNNQAFAMSTGEYFLLLNSDTIVYENSLERMVEYLDNNPDYGAVTTTLHNPDGTIQYYMHRRFHDAITLPLALLHKRVQQFLPKRVAKYLYLNNDFTNDFDIDQAAGANLMVRKSIVDEFKQKYNEDLLNLDLFPLYYNDVDICYRLWKRGYKIRCLTSTHITHLKGMSVGQLGISKNSHEYVYSSLSFFKHHGLTRDFWILRFLYGVIGTVGLSRKILKVVFTLKR